MNKIYLSISCIAIFLTQNNCNTNIVTQIPTADAQICIYPERKNGSLPKSQSFFHTVYIKSNDILIQFNSRNDNCYFFTKLPVGKLFQLDSVSNESINAYRYKWKNDGFLSRGIYGRYNYKNQEKLEIKSGEMNNFGNYKLIVEFDENKIPKNEWDVSGGKGTAAIVLEASYEIIKLE